MYMHVYAMWVHTVPKSYLYKNYRVRCNVHARVCNVSAHGSEVLFVHIQYMWYGWYLVVMVEYTKVSNSENKFVQKSRILKVRAVPTNTHTHTM